jgi:hydrophobe/amphiphile efflux-1 (HAE1) family protein
VNISEIFIRRPVATVLLTLGFMLLGIVAYFNLPIAALPNLERPNITVRAFMPGANAQTVASSLTTPLEQQLGLISGLEEMSSSSIYGNSTIKMEFSLNKSMDVAAGEVQAAINAAGPSLPKEVQGNPPTYIKADPNGLPIMAIALTSDIYTIPEIYEYADTVLAGRMSQIDGVADVRLSGGGRPAIRVQFNPGRLANMGISSIKLRKALQRASLTMPKGQISEGPRAITIATNDQLFDVADYRELVVGVTENGAPMKLGDVANVFQSTVDEERAAWFDEKPAVVITIMKTRDANVVETVDRILQLLPQIERWIPPTIRAHVIYDRTLSIRAAIADVQFTLVIAVALVIMVTAIFLRRLWLTIISSITIPVCLTMTLGTMYLLGFSLNNISLMGMTIAVGFIVDDAIIMIENITRLTKAGQSPFQAALNGARHMGFTIVSISVALVAALTPSLFMPDIVGRLFREFGLTLVAAIAASAIVSLTLTPMLCGHLLRPERERTESRFGRFCDRCIDTCVRWYLRSLNLSLKHRWVAITGALAFVCGSIVLYMAMPKGFLPTQDTGVLRVKTVSRSNISFDAKKASQREIADIVVSDPAVDHLASYVGKGPISGGVILVSLKGPKLRTESVEEIIARLRPKVETVEDSRAIFSARQDLNVGARRSASRFQYTMSGLDQDEVSKWAEIMFDRISAMPEATDVIHSGQKTGLGVNLVINRARAAGAGVTVAEVDDILYDWFGQRPLQLIRYPTNFHRIVLEVEPDARADPRDLGEVFLTEGIPVDVLGVRKRDHALLAIAHESGLPAITISFNTPPGVSLDEAQAAIAAIEKEVRLPDEIKREWRGEARAFEEAKSSQPLLFLAAIVAVYIILGILYESYAHPFTILSTLPSSTCGALLALAVTGTEFTIIAAIACILVVGIAMKNAILMVDFALDGERREGLPAETAIRQAARLRVRPIVMTTVAAIFVAIPLALSTGFGCELRQPLGIAAIGGLFLAQFVTLYTTPAVYLCIAGLSRKRSGVIAAH